MWHGGGWFMYMRSGDEKPKVTRDLLLRVLSYARGYWWHIGGMLVTILLTTGLSLLTPLIFRRMIDVVIPQKDMNGLVVLSLALLFIPAVTGFINVIQRRLNAMVGEPRSGPAGRTRHSWAPVWASSAITSPAPFVA